MPYPFEGWGLTEDGQSLIASDGTAQLYFLDPVLLKERRENSGSGSRAARSPA